MYIAYFAVGFLSFEANNVVLMVAFAATAILLRAAGVGNTNIGLCSQP